jgi:hypothetical protein
VEKSFELEVEVSGLQDAQALKSAAADFEFPQRSRTGWIDVQNLKLFLSEPLCIDKDLCGVIYRYQDGL